MLGSPWKKKEIPTMHKGKGRDEKYEQMETKLKRL